MSRAMGSHQSARAKTTTWLTPPEITSALGPFDLDPLFARTETAGFVSEVWGKATAVRFLHGRLHFHHADGTRAAANSGAPSVLVAYGERAMCKLRDAPIPGTFVMLRTGVSV